MKQFIIAERIVILQNFEKGLTGFIVEFTDTWTNKTTRIIGELFSVRF
jgi:hypothetical protein